MSAPDRNYDEGNRELLEVVVALQEWRHWLEGTQQPFMIWKDHKNILYLRSARCLNSRQACWFLYLSCFNYTLSYQFCSQNSSLKSYLRFTPELSSLDTEPIVPSSLGRQPGRWRNWWRRLSVPSQNQQTDKTCVTARHPPSWCTFLPFVEYIHNSFTRAATGMTPFNPLCSTHRKRRWPSPLFKPT